jgi:hypothetical protein
MTGKKMGLTTAPVFLVKLEAGLLRKVGFGNFWLRGALGRGWISPWLFLPIKILTIRGCKYATVFFILMARRIN